MTNISIRMMNRALVAGLGDEAIGRETSIQARAQQHRWLPSSTNGRAENDALPMLTATVEGNSAGKRADIRGAAAQPVIPNARMRTWW